MSEPLVLHETDARGVATLYLNRPLVNNAYDGALIDALSNTVAQLAARAGTRIIVIRGHGRHFQAGADLDWLEAVAQRDEAANLDASRRTADAMRALNELSLPTIALIHGACIGGGTGIAASCDVVIAERNAVFAISEARWGMVASIIAPQLLAAMGPRNVRRYALSCERFDALRARELGLVHEVCDAGELDNAAAPVIDAFLQVGPEALALTKRRVLLGSESIPRDAEYNALVAEHAVCRQSDEAREGRASFREKRSASWCPE